MDKAIARLGLVDSVLASVNTNPSLALAEYFVFWDSVNATKLLVSLINLLVEDGKRLVDASSVRAGGPGPLEGTGLQRVVNTIRYLHMTHRILGESTLFVKAMRLWDDAADAAADALCAAAGPGGSSSEVPEGWWDLGGLESLRRDLYGCHVHHENMESVLLLASVLSASHTRSPASRVASTQAETRRARVRSQPLVTGVPTQSRSNQTPSVHEVRGGGGGRGGGDERQLRWCARGGKGGGEPDLNICESQT